MKKINQFINRYPLSKTLKFSLIPVGKTEENFNNALYLETDRERAEEYKKAKKLIDNYHRHFIEEVLSKLYIDEVKEYASLYYQNGKTDIEQDKMEAMEAKMRKVIAKAFSSHKNFNSLFNKDIIQKILPDYLQSEGEKATISMFHNFTTYFTGFQENRKNIYTDEAIPTAIPHRCINENLPKFLDNALSFEKVKQTMPEEFLKNIDEECLELNGIYAKDIFCVDYFSFVLSQSGIDKYNNIIGGYTTDAGVKVQGINEHINLYNQQIAKQEVGKKLPFMKMLYKQILSDKESISFIPESFENDNEVISAINEYFSGKTLNTLDGIKTLFSKFATYNMNGIFVKSGSAITDISNSVFGDWGTVVNGWNMEYEDEKPINKAKNIEKYIEERDKAYKKIASFSISKLSHLAEITSTKNVKGNIPQYYSEAVNEKTNKILENLKKSEKLLKEDYTVNNTIKLCKNDDAIHKIKTLLDSVKELERLLKSLLGSGKEEEKDDVFYGEFLPIYDCISSIDHLYDKIRNYITKKPYSSNKIKLNFDNPQLLGGWDKNKERDYRTVILRKSQKYYLAVMDKSDSKVFLEYPSGNANAYEKLEYKLLPGPNKMLPKVFFATSNLEYYKPSKEILDIRKKESFKKGDTFNLKDCHTFIDFFKDSISKHPDWSQFGFEFSPTKTYKDISIFYNEVKKQGYSIKFKPISEDYINTLVETGKIYLFEIYSKDFSEHSQGTPNLHTLYFKMLFDEKNLADVVYQLNGGAEMFYRDASIKDTEKIVHPANVPIKNKNLDKTKNVSIFTYDLIKDRRYTKRQFSLHIPITLNFKADGQTFINNDVRKAIKDSEKNYVIGIDRGERNLLYICVIDNDGNVVEQKSLNEIISPNGYKVDYHKLLDSKEKGREDARENWGTIENIKELKEGYLSQVVYEICHLVQKYDAIIAMEDLNFGFKKGRFKVEKQVYQKFENMLITKLNYLVNKNANPDENGGLLKAYQLTNKVDGVNKAKQNGFIFYVPAWLTSKIDPVTGFANLINPKYKSIKDSVEFINNINDIRYNALEDLFEFDIDYAKFPKACNSYRSKWTVCTNGERIISYRNKDKNNSWDNKTINLSAEFKRLFEKYNINYISSNIKDDILSQDSAEFYKQFMYFISVTLQMRNSETGSVDVDYLISPVKDKNGTFYDSRNYAIAGAPFPANADANGAYNIAKKALWAINVLKETPDDKLKNADLSIKNAEWLKYVQK
ncbi:MAG: type V CRISPR-associated protein Cas12a/Cpf1 [Clostridia bacterium]|nr:type V CRISPR-associated protein Cas12a/Cpf1 [Clostridia bacterium]